MRIMYNIQDEINTIFTMKAKNTFKQYIDSINFPYYSNLEENTRISFDFPITVFVGPNGSGKSSTLYALYGSPEGYTPFRYWFETVVDKIEERHAFFYTYTDDKNNKSYEILKSRINREGNPDYWETSRPVQKYGMKKLPKESKSTRNTPIKKPVVYMNFRAELSAFERYFFNKNKVTNRQDYIRRKCYSLKNILENEGKIIKIREKQQNEKMEILSKDVLETVSNILGKKYLSGKLLLHKFFKEWGDSVIFKDSSYEYTEAHAGSGELAIINLVNNILKADKYSLVLLDEPETSLHPGAQKKLKEFIFQQVKTKQLQVIISTHSPTLIESLPNSAIKVFSRTSQGKFKVENKCVPEEAFYYIGQSNPNVKEVIVEDKLAKEILEHVIKSEDDSIKSLFEIKFYRGGADLLKQKIVYYSEESEYNKFILFDGDQKPETSFSVDELKEKEKNISFLDNKIKEIVKIDPKNLKFHVDGNNKRGGNKTQQIEARIKYLKYFETNVDYLPLKTPEEMIWDDNILNSLSTLITQDQLENIIKEDDFKIKFKNLIESLTSDSDSSSILTTQKIFITQWIKSKNNDYQILLNYFDKIKNYGT